MDLLTVARADAPAAVDNLLSVGGHPIRVAAQTLFDLDIALANAVLDAVAGERPYARDNIRDVLGVMATPLEKGLRFGPGPVVWGVAGIWLLHAFKMWRYRAKRKAIISGAPGFVIERPVVSLRNADKAALRGMALLFKRGQLTRSEWISFVGALAWNQGRERLIPAPGWVGDRHIEDVRKFIDTFARHLWPDAAAVVANAGQRLAHHANQPTRKTP